MRSELDAPKNKIKTLIIFVDGNNRDTNGTTDGRFEQKKMKKPSICLFKDIMIFLPNCDDFMKFQ